MKKHLKPTNHPQAQETQGRIFQGFKPYPKERKWRRKDAYHEERAFCSTTFTRGSEMGKKNHDRAKRKKAEPNKNRTSYNVITRKPKKKTEKKEKTI